MNPAAERFYQLGESEALARSTRDVWVTDFGDDESDGDVVQAVNERGSWNGRTVQAHWNGRSHRVDAQFVGVRDETGRHEATFCFFTPVRPEEERRRAPGIAPEARFVQLFEHLPEALILQDADGVVLDANPAAGRLYGYDRWDLVGRRVEEIVGGLDAETSARHSTLLEEHGFFVARSLGVRSDGGTFPQEITVTRLMLAGRPVAAVLARDLAERQHLEAQLAGLTDLARLHESGQTLEQVARAALHLAGRTVSTDRAALATFQPDGRVEWLASEGMDEFIEATRGTRPDEVPWLARAVRTGQPSFSDRRAPGHEHSPVSPVADRLGIRAFAIVPLKSGDELTGALGLVWSAEPPALAHDRDLLTTIGRLTATALGNVRLRDSLMAGQRALDESEARYRVLFEEAPQAVIVESLDGEILDANPAAARLYRRDRSELVGRRVQDLALLDDQAWREQMDVLRRNGRGVFRFERLRGDGSTFPSEANIVVGRIDGHERLLVQIRDLTDEERLQQELLQAQKMEALGQLVAGVAHELNNPLAAIVAFSQLMRGDERLPPDLHRDAGLLVQEADRTRRIVQNLLEFARQRRPERRPTSLRELVQRTLELQSYSLGAGAISVKLELPEDLPPVDVDRIQIQQVLLNLTLNAIQSIRGSKASGEIAITASHERRGDAGDAGGVRVSVSDDGPGVPESARDHLFEPFFTTKPVGEGTGLGLSVSYGIVTSHGGRLWHEPRPGGGATFVVELPAAPDVVMSPVPALPRSGTLSPRPVTASVAPTQAHADGALRPPEVEHARGREGATTRAAGATPASEVTERRTSGSATNGADAATSGGSLGAVVLAVLYGG